MHFVIKKTLTIKSVLWEKLAFSLLSPRKRLVLIMLIIKIFEKDFKREKNGFKNKAFPYALKNKAFLKHRR